MAITRSAIMVSNFFPFFMRYWLEVFNRKWADKVDMVYIGMDQPFELSVEPYLRKLFKHPKITLTEGYATQFKYLTDLFHLGKEELVMVLHDDTFFIDSDKLDTNFKIAEKGKIVTPLYNHYSPPDYVEKLMKEKFGNKVPFKCEADSAYSFLLYFFIAQRKQLEKTSVNFCGGDFKAGTYFKPLDTMLEQTIGGDTGFQLGLELLANGEEFNPIPHHNNTTYYLATDENPLEKLLKMKKEKSGLFNTDWIHVMGMANNFKIWFREGKEYRMKEFQNYKGQQSFVNGTEMRLGWLIECISCDTFKEIADYRDYIKIEINDIVKEFGLDWDRTKTYSKLFHEMIWRNHD